MEFEERDLKEALGRKEGGFNLKDNPPFVVLKLQQTEVMLWGYARVREETVKQLRYNRTTTTREIRSESRFPFVLRLGRYDLC